MLLKERYYGSATALNLPIWKEKTAESKRIFNNIFNDFLRISTIHGVPRIFGRSSTKTERLLWAFGFITSALILSYVTWRIGYIYHHKPMKTVISELKSPIFKIPFPEVTICNHNRLNWDRIEEAKSMFLEPRHRTRIYENIFESAVTAYDTLRFGKFHSFRNISKVTPPELLLDINYVNFTMVIKFMAWKCHEILSDCFWTNRPYDCCELFAPRNSQEGLCLSFNGIESEERKMKEKTDPFYPWHTAGRGPENGLVLRLHTRERQHSPYGETWKGGIVMLNEPYVWAYLPYDVPTNTRVTVTIAAYIHYHDETTRIFSTEARQCVFEDELSSMYFKTLQDHKYMYENCLSECQQEYLTKYCNCSFDLFYPPGRYRACGLVDLPCLYEHNDDLQVFEQAGERDFVAYHKSGMNCPCFFNCKSVNYFTETQVDDAINADNLTNINGSQIAISVFFLWEHFMVYKTTAVYTILDLMASLGGLASLCIGCSLVGITEFLYFVFVDAPKQLLFIAKSRKEQKLNRNSLRTKQIFVREKLVT